MKDTTFDQRPSLAIISSYDDLCGIAGYTRKVEEQLSRDFDVEVFNLDQFFMRAKGGNIAKEADANILEFCDRLRGFDCVNIQLEYGTLGYWRRDILRRLTWLVEAAPSLLVTFHTILAHRQFPYDAVRRSLFRFELWNTYKTIRDHREEAAFRGAIHRLLRSEQDKKPLSVIVHTRRDAKKMRHIERIKKVFDHPLAFIGTDQALRLRETADWRDFDGLKDLPDDTKMIGVFGFLGQYKGIHTAIKALRHLPENYHLAVFGGLHPQEIVASETAHPYVQRLLGEIGVDQTLLDAIGQSDGTGPTLSVQADDPGTLTKSPLDLSGRVHFMGSLPDAALETAAAGVDVVVLPYFEVGQSSSGPMSMAIDLGARIVASRNQAFLQIAKYHPERLSLFEIGNHLEMAQQVLAEVHRARPQLSARFNAETNAAVYRQALLGEGAGVVP